MNKLLTDIIPAGNERKRHPKCKGSKYWTDCGWEYDCDYNTTLDCDQCKYGGGRCDPEAKKWNPENN